MGTYTNKRLLVTGGAGFIGSELVRQLVEDGAHVTVLDNLTAGHRRNLEALPADGYRLVVADIRDLERVDALMPGIDAVFHLACRGVRHSIHSPVENHGVNATGTLGLLKSARAADVPRFVYVSTSEVYGSAPQVPMSEDNLALPTTVYGASKLAGECYTRAFHRTYDYPTVVVRPFNSYGPRSHHEGDSGEVIPKFMLRSMAGLPMVVFGDGSQTRDFTFVADTARGILAAGASDAAVGETINVGSGKEITVAELAATVSKVVGGGDATIEHVEQRPGDVLRLKADVSRATALLGWAPTVPLADGLSQLRDWYLQGGSSPEDLLAEEKVRNWELV
ncbi:dTDP-glucose 4,6-dehydratase [Pseudonocardia benzenivorans]|jgi:UDP-glucose 4-epimerase|uniref:dTDP-glucose 4,6-dehydratase n=2 Tax=Pseudonocardia TaxID=1847 RepID=F4CSN7_PSEUX|nr:SDR family NAD(P)-dependent oxidoreductase [Pseudonocardia dioxanivorans]AEA24109.1 dTDP-glucose 4,6-dehydratase [Pseudonocardia dioxanivorans CB1190]GJF07455.1 epimerase [Pseudonocardia sp. D17]